MCWIRLLGPVTLEVFPSLDCDDVTRIQLLDLEMHAELEVEVVEVNHGVLFTFADGRSSSLPPEALEVVKSCNLCDTDWHIDE